MEKLQDEAQQRLNAANANSAQPCGCDTGADHQCEYHAQLSRVAYKPRTTPTQVTERAPYILLKQALKLTDAAQRKTYPIATGVLDYFPKALAEIAHVSYVGNVQHNPDLPLHWDRTKSTDEADALIRHFTERGTLDTDGLRHTAKVAWRALAMLEKELEEASK